MEMIAIAEPKLVDAPEMRFAGIWGEYTRERTSEIPLQWDVFNAHPASHVDGPTYGIVFPLAVMKYMTAIALVPGAAAPEGWETMTIPARRYAVFAETGGIPRIRQMWMTLFGEWLPKSALKLAQGEAMLEIYPESWATSGDFEIWLPLAGETVEDAGRKDGASPQ